MGEMSFAEAARDALADEMRRDPTVWVLGEDVRHGGIFGQYRGLVDEFGPDRVVDTPISESTIMGAGLGAALVGTRPVIEMRIADFAMPAMDELVNQIAKVRYMFGGQARARRAHATRAPRRLGRPAQPDRRELVRQPAGRGGGDARYGGRYGRASTLGNPVR